MRRLAVALGVLALLASSGLAGTPDFAGMQVQAFDPPRAAPPFALPDLAGQTVRLEDFRGKVVMLVFWATW